MSGVANGRDVLRFDLMLQRALLGVLREALVRVAEHGLPGAHHFYITFKTAAPGVVVPDQLYARYPEEMTIVLQYEFWGLEVTEEAFAVTLSFNSRPERLSIPFSAVVSFADPSVRFGLQFQPSSADKEGTDKETAGGEETQTAAADAATPAAEEKRAGGEKVVTLDQFRRK